MEGGDEEPSQNQQELETIPEESATPVHEKPQEEAAAEVEDVAPESLPETVPEGEVLTEKHTELEAQVVVEDKAAVKEDGHKDEGGDEAQLVEPPEMNRGHSKQSKLSVSHSKSIHYESGSLIDSKKKSAANLGKQSSKTARKSVTEAGDNTSTSSLKRRLSMNSDGRDLDRSRTDRLGSKARAVVGSILSIKRLSFTGEAYDRKMARYANTFKLEADNPFNTEKVQKILEVVMVEALENLTYDPDKCPKQAKWASSAIRAKVKELDFDRYKLVCLVTIGQKNSQDVLATCRFLWDTDRDRYATFSLENTYVFGIAQCFGLYYE